MSDRVGEDALLDVGCYLNRFEVDSTQGLSWKSHTYLANKSHILPVRLLQTVTIDHDGAFVCARDRFRGSVSSNGTPQERFQLALAAAKDSDVKYFTLFDPTGDLVTDEELAQIAALAPIIKVTDLRLYGRLTHLSPVTLHRFIFSFSSVQELTLHGFNGNQITDEHLIECGRRQICRLCVVAKAADAEPVAFSEDALIDFLFAPELGMSKREVVLTAFNASPQFVQKLVSRAHVATNIDRIDLQVQQLPLGRQELGGMHLTQYLGFAKHYERLENGARLTLQFGHDPMSPRRDESDDKFRFILRL